MNTDKQEQEALKADYYEVQRRKWTRNGIVNEHMAEYCTSEAARFVRLSTGDILAIEKPKIKTSFCFGYSDSRYDTEDYDRANDMAAHAQRDEQYFMRENLNQIQEQIDTLDGIGRFGNNVPYLFVNDGEASLQYEMNRYNFEQNNRKPISKEDMAAIRAAYVVVLAEFEKRLNRYLKRYGMSKVRTWSYWRDA